MFKNIKISYRLGISIVLTLVIIMGIMLPLMLRQLNNLSGASEKRQLGTIQDVLHKRIVDTSGVALKMIDCVVSMPEVSQAFANNDKERLKDLTLPIFEVLKKKFKVSQMQFHLPPATSYLRLHKLEKSGDDLSFFRFSVVDANTQLKSQYGPEIGVAGIGLRGVTPVFYDGKHIGSAEFGLNFGQPFFDDFTKEFGVPTALLLPGEKAGKFNIYASTVPGGTTLSEALFAKALAGETVFYKTSRDGVEYSVMVQQILNFKGVPLGVVEVLFERSEYKKIYEKSLTQILIITGGVLLVVLMLALLLSRTITKPIEELTIAAEEISMGKLDYKINGIDRKDEIGLLAGAISRMAASIKLAIEKLNKH